MPPSGKRKYDQFALAYHGNWCGPGWSGGQYQNSVMNGAQPTDAFDAICQTHDRAYAANKNLRTADFQFAKENIGYHKKDSFYINMKRNIAGLAVLTQGVARMGLRSPSPFTANLERIWDNVAGDNMDMSGKFVCYVLFWRK